MENKYTKLAVFDLDGTLLDTPLPEEGMKIYKEKTGEDWPFSGWWGRPLSLDSTIFDIKTIPSVIESYKKERKDKDTLVVMVTGRINKLSNEVRNLLDSEGLTFDGYYYNKGGYTILEKIKTLENLLTENKNIISVEMWDDRDSHIPVFKEWGSDKVEEGRLKNFKINHVPQNRH